MSSDRLLFKGYGCINPIPFRDDDTIDEDEYRRHVEFMVAGGVRFLMPGGLAGHGLVLSEEECLRVVALTVEQVRSRIGVFPCCHLPIGTRNTIKFIEEIARLGADGAYIPTPMVRGLGSEAIRQHYREIIENTRVPVILYNSFGTTGNRLSYPVVEQLLDEFPGRIVGYKDGDLDSLPFTVGRLAHRIGIAPTCRDKFIWSGLQQGTQAQVSSCGAFVPREIAEIFRLFESGRREEAGELFFKYLPLFELLTGSLDPRQPENRSSLPSLCAHILNRMGFGFGRPRLPYPWPLPEEHGKYVDGVLDGLNLRART